MNTNIDRTTHLFIFTSLFHLLHIACTMTIIAKMSMKNNHKKFLNVAKTKSLLSAVYVGDNLAANRWLQMLLLLL